MDNRKTKSSQYNNIEIVSTGKNYTLYRESRYINMRFAVKNGTPIETKYTYLVNDNERFVAGLLDFDNGDSSNRRCPVNIPKLQPLNKVIIYESHEYLICDYDGTWEDTPIVYVEVDSEKIIAKGVSLGLIHKTKWKYNKDINILIGIEETQSDVVKYIRQLDYRYNRYISYIDKLNFVKKYKLDIPLSKIGWVDDESEYAHLCIGDGQIVSVKNAQKFWETSNKIYIDNTYDEYYDEDEVFIFPFGEFKQKFKWDIYNESLETALARIPANDEF